MAPTRWVVALILGCLLLAATVVNSFRIRDKSSSSAEVSKEVPFQKVRLDIIKRDPGKIIPKNEPEIKVKQIPVKQKTPVVEDTKFNSKVITLKPSLDLSKVEKPILSIKKPVVSFKISKKDDDDDDEDDEDSDNSDKKEASETESDLSDNENSDNNNKNVNTKKKTNIRNDDSDDDDDDDSDDDDSDNDDDDSENSDKDNISDDDDDGDDDDDSSDDKNSEDDSSDNDDNDNSSDDDDDESDEDEDSETDTDKKKYNKKPKSKRNVSDNDDESEDDEDDDDDDENSDKEDTSDDEKNIESESENDDDDDDGDDEDDDNTDDSGSDTENRKNKSKINSESDIDKSDDDNDSDATDNDDDGDGDDSEDDASDSNMSEKDGDDSDNDVDDSDGEKNDETDKESETDETSDSESETIKIGSKFKLKTVIPYKPQAAKESLIHKTSDIKPSTNKIDPTILSTTKLSGKEASEFKKSQEKPITTLKKSEPIKIDPPPNKIDSQKVSEKKQNKEEKLAVLPKKSDIKPEVKKDIVPDIKKQNTPSAKPPQPKPISEPQKELKKEIPHPIQSKPIPEPQKVIKKDTPTKPAPSTPKPKQPEDKKEKDIVKKEIKDSKTKKPQKSTKKRAERAPGVLRRKNMHASDFDDFYAFFPTFAPNFSRIHNPECRRHGQILIRQLRGAKIWTLQMLDSTAKIPSGLLRGNGNQLGDFDQCLGTKARVKLDSGSIVKVFGKYCLAQIDIKPINDEARLAVHLAQARSFIRSTYNDPGHFIPRFTTLNWGVCLPASCEAEDAEFIIRDSLRHYNGTTGLKININVDPINCFENSSDPWYEEWLDIPTILTLSLYTIVICIIAYATTKDYLIYGEKPSSEEETNESIEKPQEDNEETEKADEEEVKKEDNEEGKSDEEPKNEESDKPSTLVLAFSLKQSVGKLFRDGSAEGDIECIHGIRALCSIALYIAHKLIPLGMMPFTNRSYLTEVSNSPFSSALRASLLYTDTFLLLSGVLTAYHMSQDIDKTGSIPWLKRYIARYIRLTPAVVAVLLWYAWISDKLGEGPMWGTAVTQNAELCQQNLWQNVFYIQNFFPFEEMCAPHTHQLALDMQLWWLAPFSVWMLRSKPMMALPVLGVLHSMAVYLRYSAALGSHLSLVIYHGITVRQLFRTANLCYTLSLHRATPYLAGIGLGVLLQQFTKEVTLPKLLYIPGWLISLYFGCWAIYTPAHMALRDYQYNANEAAQYAALASVAWALALSWVIFACFTGAGGVINKLLCSRPLVVISRISYCMYLCQFLIFFYNVGSARSSSEFTISQGINVLEVISVLTASVILTLLFDIPMQTLRVSIMSIEIKSSSSQKTDEDETENQTEGEQIQQEVEENSSEVREEVTQEVIYEEDEEEMMIHHDVEQDIIYEEEEEEIAEGEGEPEYEYEEEIVWVEEEVEEEEEEEPENKETEAVIQEVTEEGTEEGGSREEGGSQEELEDWEWTNENSSGGTNQFYNYRRW